MKILNKFIWSKTEPKNKNDVWFDGSVFNLYRGDNWEAFTLPVDAAEKVAEVIKNASNVYQEKLTAGKGITIKNNVISASQIFQIVNSLPPTGEYNTIYLVYSTEKEYSNQLIEYIYIDDRWEKLGEFKVDVDLSDYAKKSEVPTKMSQLEQDVELDTEIRNELTKLSERIEENEVLIEDLQNTKIDREADDYYPKLAVGLADNLSGVDVVDSEVNFRRSGGGAISDGVARIEAIKGNSVVWNQLINGAILRASGSGTTIANDGDIYTITPNGIDAYPGIRQDSYYVPMGHKYYVGFDVLFDGDLSVGLNIRGQSAENVMSGGSWKSDQRIITLNSSTNNAFIIFFRNAKEDVKVKNIRCIDLTQMFGAGNEPTTIEEFYARIPMGVDLNAYNEGEVIHMNVQSIESQGVNAWGGELERGKITEGNDAPSSIMARSIGYMNIIPNAEYYVTCRYYVYIYFYDRNKNFISNIGAVTTFRTPSNAHYLRFTLYLSGGTVELDTQVCINLSDTSINGKYFPYIKRTEDLSIIRKYFPQGMKLAGTAHDEIRYNKATQKWEYSKGRIKGVDLGTLDWRYTESTKVFSCQFNDMTESNITSETFFTCAKYQVVSYATASSSASSSLDKIIYKANNFVGVKDSAYTDAASFKAMLQEKQVILYYESNDWEWVELDAEDQFKDLDYQVWNCGTEKAIAEGKSAPLAADITYGFNAIGKIKELESIVAQLRAKVGI